MPAKGMPECLAISLSNETRSAKSKSAIWRRPQARFMICMSSTVAEKKLARRVADVSTRSRETRCGFWAIPDGSGPELPMPGAMLPPGVPRQHTSSMQLTRFIRPNLPYDSMDGDEAVGLA